MRIRNNNKSIAVVYIFTICQKNGPTTRFRYRASHVRVEHAVKGKQRLSTQRGTTTKSRDVK